MMEFFYNRVLVETINSHGKKYHIIKEIDYDFCLYQFQLNFV